MPPFRSWTYSQTPVNIGVTYRGPLGPNDAHAGVLWRAGMNESGLPVAEASITK
jgi:hypothetical protein